MKVITVLGTRPEFTKAYLVSRSLKEKKIDEYVIHTGQHYDDKLSRDIFNDVGFREPDINLNIGSGTHGWQTGKMLIELEKILIKNRPDAVIVYGDTNSALAGALTAAKLNLPVVHVEAGERLGMRDNPEEINRKICDHVASLNCCATPLALKFLKQEGLNSGVLTGDIMLDSFLEVKNSLEHPKMNLPKEYSLLTIHRAENTDGSSLGKVMRLLNKIPGQKVWPLHPRTQKVIEKSKLAFQNIWFLPPVTYKSMLWLESHAKRVVTDSGGVQKEAYWSGVPCFTVFPQTGWKVTLKGNWNQLVKKDGSDISAKLKHKPKGKPDMKYFGNGNASDKIVKEMIKLLK